MIKFKFIRDLSIKNKIIVIVLSITFLVHSIGFTFITIWDVNRIKSEIQSGLALNTKLVATNCVVPLIFGDDQQATKALSNLSNIEFIETGCLFDKEGNVFASYPDTLNENSIQGLQQHQDNEFKDGYFYVKELVYYQNEIYGTLLIKANSNPLKTAKWNIILTLVLLSIVLDVLSIILASRMQKYVSLPIIKLKGHFDKVAKDQDFSFRVSKINNDEIGILYDGFNRFLGEIESRSKARDFAAASLKTSKEKLDLALESGEIGVWEWDLKTNRVVWDTKMEKMFGLKEGSFNQTFEAYRDCLHPDDIALNEKAIQDAFNDVAPFDNIYRIVWENKEIKFIRAKALISKDEGQNPVKMIGVCFDVTEIKEAEAELKGHRESLENLVQERTKKLEAKNEELEGFNQLFVDREFRIKELKDEISRLKFDKENQSDVKQ